MSAEENFEIDTAQAATTAVPTTDETVAAAEGDGGLDAQEEPADPRPVWDIEYKLGDGGGVVEIHADSADEARATFATQQPGAEILTVEPG